MILDVKAKATQVTPVSPIGEGDFEYPRMSKTGAMFTAGWKQQLAAAGLVWMATMGDLTAGGDVSPITGGGNGSVIDNNQPEFVIGVDAGYYLIPISANVGIKGNSDGDVDEFHILLYADRSAGPVTTNASATLVTPVNMLDGGGAFPGRCWEASTADITEPVVSQWLDFVSQQSAQASAAGMTTMPVLHLDYNPKVPPILAGPCQIVLVFGATEAAVGIGNVVVAAVPTAYFPVS